MVGGAVPLESVSARSRAGPEMGARVRKTNSVGLKARASRNGGGNKERDEFNEFKWELPGAFLQAVEGVLDAQGTVGRSASATAGKLAEGSRRGMGTSHTP